jgi:hypothetical protein
VWGRAGEWWAQQLRGRKHVRQLCDLWNAYSGSYEHLWGGGTVNVQKLTDREGWNRFSQVAFILVEDQAIHDDIKTQAFEANLEPTVFTGLFIEHAFTQQRGAYQTTDDEADGTFVNPADAPPDHGPKTRVVETMAAQTIQPEPEPQVSTYWDDLGLT